MDFLKNLNTIFIGRNLLEYEELESTQDLAHKLANENITDGTVIITNNQTKGKGTNGRSWYSTEGQNLTFSLILYPNCDIEKLENITVETAEVISKAISKLYNISLQIKYPNDLKCNSKKVGGILTESKVLGSLVKELIIGIGINVNTEEMSEEISDIATSLKLEYSKDFDISAIFTEFLNQFEKIYLTNVKQDEGRNLL